MIKLIQLEKNTEHKEITYDPNETLKTLIRKHEPTASVHSYRIALNNTQILDWNLPMKACVCYGDTIYLHKFRNQETYKDFISIRLINESDSNKLIEFKVDLSHTIYDLKNLIQKYSKIEPCDQHLQFDQQILDEDEKKMWDYGIKDGSTVLVKRMVRGGLAINIAFADVSKAGDIVKLSKTGPDWRIVCHGLNLMGICENKKCNAYDDYVLMHEGLGVYNVEEDTHSECPECLQDVRVLTCGFYKCSFKFVGVKIEDVETRIKTEWRKIEQNFYSYHRKGLVVWRMLCIETKSLQEKSTPKTKDIKCHYCLTEIEPSVYVKECGHFYHANCAFKSQFKCVSCVGNMKNKIRERKNATNSDSEDETLSVEDRISIYLKKCNIKK